MDHEIINSYLKLDSLNVSRETFLDFESYISFILEKNKEIRPKTMGQALRIDGITPAAVYILLSHVKRKSIKHIA